MNDSWNALFGTGSVPHGHCLALPPSILWSDVVADIILTVSYYSIPLAILYFLRRKKNSPFRTLLLFFAAFMFTAGTRHLVDVFSFWNTAHDLTALVKVIAAFLSALSAIILWKMMPVALRSRIPDELEKAIANRNDDLRKSEENIAYYRDRLKALASRLEEIREEERTRISRELHDQLGQELTILKIGLSAAADTLAEPGMNEHTLAVHKQLKANISNVDVTIKSVRRIASQLRPPILDGLGLAAALEWHVEEFSRKTGLTCTFSSTNECEKELDPNHATALFRAAQELLTNVARHANATNVHVELRRTEEHTTLELTDDGIGITNAGISRLESMGLLSLRERVTATGGTFEITNRESGGTRARIEIFHRIDGNRKKT